MSRVLVVTNHGLDDPATAHPFGPPVLSRSLGA
jgi:hypothetical protein